jgi:hypothetical protein
MAYLIKHKNLSYEDAFSIVKKARKFINPNKGFKKFLSAYADK